MQDYPVSIVISFHAPRELHGGDVVELVAEPDNPADKNAVAVYMDDFKVGYIANSQNTILRDTIPAAKLSKLIQKPSVSRTTALLLSEDTFTNAAGKTQQRFLAKAFFVPNRTQSEPEKPIYTATVGGTVGKNDGKPKILGKLVQCAENGTEPHIPVRVVKELFAEEEVYRVYADVDENGIDRACGEIIDAYPSVYAIIDKKGGRVSGCVTKGMSKNSYEIQLFPDMHSVNEYADGIDAAVKRGVGQVKELEEKVEFMLESEFSNALICAVLEQLQPMPNGEPAFKPETFYRQMYGTNLADVIAHILGGETTRLIGEAGSGKNTLIATACWLLNRPMCRVQGSEDLTDLDLLGSRTLMNGNTSFELSDMLKTLLIGGVVVIDEVNTIRPGVLTLLHSLTDDARAIDVPGYGRVRMHERSCILYTMNEDYVGTGEMNQATIDRGPAMVIERESDLSELLYNAVPGVEEAAVALCVKISDAIQKAVRESGGTVTDAVVTTRGYIAALKSRQYIPLKRGLIQNVANKAQSKSERLAVESIITSFCG